MPLCRQYPAGRQPDGSCQPTLALSRRMQRIGAYTSGRCIRLRLHYSLPVKR